MEDMKLSIAFGADIKPVQKALKNLEKTMDKTLGKVEKSIEESAEQFESFEKEAKDAQKGVGKQLDKMADNAEDAFDDMEDSFEDAMDDMEKDAKNAGKKIERELEDVADSGESAFSKMAKGVGKSLAVIGTALAGVTAGIGAFVEGQMETIASTKKLEGAFQKAGGTAKQAQSTYKEFYRILGDSDTATEASQLLANMTTNQQELNKWTTIARGVWTTFGDSLPIEGLIESVNETAKIGEVTGSLADALNWAGISEEEFNEKLAKCSTEAERQQLIMETLGDEYLETGEEAKKNSKHIDAFRDSQLRLSDAISGIAEKLAPVATALNNFASSAIEKASGYIGTITDKFTELYNKVDWDAVKEGIQTVTDYIKTVAMDVWEGFSGVFQPIIDGFVSMKDSDTARKSLERIKDVFAWIKDNAKAVGKGFGIITLGMIAMTGVSGIASMADNLAELLLVFGSVGDSQALGKMAMEGGTFATLAKELYDASRAGAAWGTESSKMTQLWQGLSGAFKQTNIGKILTGITGGFGKLFGALKPLLANPYVLAIMAIIAVFVLLWKKCEGFRNFWLGLWDKCKEAFNVAVETFKELLGGSLGETIEKFKTVFSEIGDVIKSVVEWFKNLWTKITESEAVCATFSGIMKAIGGLLSAFVSGIVAVFGGLLNGVIKAAGGIATAFGGVIKIVKGVFKLISALVHKDGKGILEAWNLIWDGVVQYVSGLWESLKGFFVGLYKGVIQIFTKLWDVLVGHSIVPDTIDGIVECFKSIWGKIKGFLSSLWKGVVNIFNKIKDKAVSIWTNVKTKTSELWNGIKSATVDKVTQIYNKVVNKFTSVKNKVVDIIKTMKNGVKGGMKALANEGFIKPLNNIIKNFLSGINMVIKGINWVVNKITGKNPISEINVGKWKIPELAKGTASYAGSSPVALVGERGRELVNDPKHGTYMADHPMLVPLSQGASVLSNPKTERLLKKMGVNAYGGGKKESWWDTVKSTGEKVWEFLKNPKDLLKTALSGINIGLDGIFSGLGDGIIGFFIDKIKDKLGKWLDESGMNYTSGNVDSYKGMIQKAAGFFGDTVSEGYMDRILQQIDNESGGNPKAIQSMAVKDINSAKGWNYLARGLLQFTPQTFAYRAVKGYTNIFDPYHQLLAFFNNTQWKKNLPKKGEKRGWTPRGALRMGSGGIVTSTTPIIAGELGSEAIIPLNGNKAKPFACSIAEGLVEALSGNNSGSSDGGEIVINLDIDLDGKTIAKKTAKFTKEELDRMTVKKGRRAGQK